MLETQNRRIDDLVERIRLQQEKLDKQNVRIKTLQSQVKKQLRTKRVHLSASYKLFFFFFSLVSYFSKLMVLSELFQAQQSRKYSNTDGSVEQSDSPVGK